MCIQNDTKHKAHGTTLRNPANDPPPSSPLYACVHQRPTSMEPVPETERMEEFRSSPVPSLRINKPNFHGLSSLGPETIKKPPTIRRSTDPSPSSSSSFSWSSLTTIPYRPRNASPLSSEHSRSSSVSGLAPPMSRTRSLPGVNGSGHILYSPLVRPGSPSTSASPSRTRAPRKPVDEAFPPSSPVRTSILDSERGQGNRSTSPGLSTLPNASGRLRRSPSPMRSGLPAGSSFTSPFQSTPSSVSTSPSYRAYDAFSPGYGAVLSSIPSTPTSARSRSPSISSLETIPDSPDAEEAALEAEKATQMKSIEEAAEGGEGSDSRSKGYLDVPIRGRTLAYGSSRDKRKRWSVCGAERRGDLDLETIWED